MPRVKVDCSIVLMQTRNLDYLSGRIFFWITEVTDNILLKNGSQKRIFWIYSITKLLLKLSREKQHTYYLEILTIEHTSSPKRYLIKHLTEETALLPSKKYLVVYPIYATDLCWSVYISIATLHGFGLCNFDLVKNTFCKITRQKFQDRKALEDTCPLTPEEIHSKMDSGPLPEIYNAI